MGYFESTAPLSVTQTPDPNTWAFLSELVFHSVTAVPGFVLRVPAGSLTDWESIPGIASWLVQKMRAAAAAGGHDHCYRVLIPAGVMTYQQADRLFLEMLAALDQLAIDAGQRRARIPAPTRWLMWDAVRLASILTRPGGRVDVMRDLPRLALVTPPALLLASATLLLLPFAGALALANRLWP